MDNLNSPFGRNYFYGNNTSTPSQRTLNDIYEQNRLLRQEVGVLSSSMLNLQNRLQHPNRYGTRNISVGTLQSYTSTTDENPQLACTKK